MIAGMRKRQMATTKHSQGGICCFKTIRLPLQLPTLPMAQSTFLERLTTTFAIWLEHKSRSLRPWIILALSNVIVARL